MDLIEESRQRRGRTLLVLRVRDESHGPFSEKNSSRATTSYRGKKFYSTWRECRPADEGIQRRAMAKQLAAREEMRQQEDEECRLLTSHGYESLQNSYDLWYSILLPARVKMVELGVSVSCKK